MKFTECGWSTGRQQSSTSCMKPTMKGGRAATSAGAGTGGTTNSPVENELRLSCQEVVRCAATRGLAVVVPDGMTTARCVELSAKCEWLLNFAVTSGRRC